MSAMNPPQVRRFQPSVSRIAAAPNVEHWLVALAPRRSVCLLDSAGGAPRRWSLLAFDPLADAPAPTQAAELGDYVSSLSVLPGDDVHGPFHGGFLGALAYDLGVHGERQELPLDAWSSPRLVGGLYTDFIVIDHDTESAWLVLGEEPGDGRPAVERRRTELESALFGPAADLTSTPSGPLTRHVTAAEHERRVDSAREFIARGEIYQANLAQRFTRELTGHPVATYRALRRSNPSPYMGYLAWGGGARPDGALLSASPELLLEVTGRHARTRPIKGTIGRGASSAEDAAQRARLLASEKDLAELAMIVDLERNDLGRIARAGSVRVNEFPALETYAAVHHLVADVECELRRGTTSLDALLAVFPGGSITGAPKLRSMEVIAELEGEGRGFFTGALGFLDTRGDMCWSILIRTLVWRPRENGGEVSLHVGGGITWNSDAAAEERETRLKGAALADALRAPGEEPDVLTELLPIRAPR